MNPKQKLITDYLKRNQGRGFYLDLHASLAFDFDDNDDFNLTLDGLVNEGILSAQDTGEETEYVLNVKKLKK